jgi:hypothetical protein
MPIIYLKHPVHGDKVAIAEQEAEFDEQNGWTRYTPGESHDTPEPMPVNELRPRRRREQKDAGVL